MPRSVAIVSTALVLLCLTQGCQTRARSMQAVCELPSACPECLEALDAGDPSRYQAYLERYAPHPHIGLMLEEAITAAPDQRVKVIRNWAATEGIENCAFADWLARPDNPDQSGATLSKNEERTRDPRGSCAPPHRHHRRQTHATTPTTPPAPA